MKKTQKTVLLLSAVLILLLAGAWLLYGRLGAGTAPEQLAVQSRDDAGSRAAAPAAPASEAEVPSGEETVSSEADSAPEDAEEGQPSRAPDFLVFTAEGEEVRLSDFLGKPVVVNGWASWCGPCKSEMADFQAKFEELGEEVQFLMVNLTDGVSETVQTASAFVEKEGYTFPVFFDSAGAFADTYGITSIPHTFFFDAEGRGVAQAVGAIDGETLQRGIDMIYSGN